MTECRARTIADGLTDRQWSTLKGVLDGKMIAEWREDLCTLKGYGLVEPKPNGKRFEVILTEDGRTVAQEALHSVH